MPKLSDTLIWQDIGYTNTEDTLNNTSYKESPVMLLWTQKSISTQTFFWLKIYFDTKQFGSNFLDTTYFEPRILTKDFIESKVYFDTKYLWSQSFFLTNNFWQNNILDQHIFGIIFFRQNIFWPSNFFDQEYGRRVSRSHWTHTSLASLPRCSSFFCIVYLNHDLLSS